MQHGVRHLSCLRMMPFEERVHLAERQDGRAQRKAGKRLAQLEDVRPGAETRVHLQHDGLAQRIDGRIGDLRKSLAEKRVEGRGARASGAMEVSSPIDQTASLPSVAIGCRIMRTSSRV